MKEGHFKGDLHPPLTPKLDAKSRLEELESVFEALAHAARRQILLTVWFRGGVVTSSEIAKRFHCAWPTISRHLNVLVQAGLLTQEKQGRNRYYRVNQAKLDVIREWLRWFDEPAGTGKERKPDERKSE